MKLAIYQLIKKRDSLEYIIRQTDQKDLHSNELVVGAESYLYRTSQYIQPLLPNPPKRLSTNSMEHLHNITVKLDSFLTLY